MLTESPDYLGVAADADVHLDDVDEAFYRLWLDPTLTYSCALWSHDEPDEALAAAQIRKLDHHVAAARAAGQPRVLDVGCGWGALLRRLVDAHGVRRAVGLTLKPQHLGRAMRPGDPRIEVHAENWFDHRPDAPYDAVVSIAAFEQFARPDLSNEQRLQAYRCFFERAHGWLRAGGWMSVQTLGLRDGLSTRPLAQASGAPLGPRYAIPTPSDLARASAGLFEIAALRDDSHDSLRTTRVWLARLAAARAAAARVAGEDVVRRYEGVLKGAVTTLRIGILRMYRVTFRRVDPLS